jgi:uncharacterized membrane protein YoaT (DUF817 family)
MPFALSACLTAGFLWLAENVGVLTKTWAYPHHGAAAGIALVPFTKFGAWLLLLIISFVCVSLVIRPQPPAPTAISKI